METIPRQLEADGYDETIRGELLARTPRLLGCLLDIDGAVLGEFFTGKGGSIKVIMAEHKDVVSAVLRALISGQDGSSQ